MIDLRNKSIVVTGAESGIGRAVALQCASLGAKVCAAGYDAAGLKETVSQADLPGDGQIIDFQVDIRQPSAIEAMFDFTCSRFGELTGVVANAGVISLAPFEELTLAEWERIIAVNLTGTFQTLWYAARFSSSRAAAVRLLQPARRPPCGSSRMRWPMLHPKAACMQ
jgi:NAD(P)-dependent dehydrogenase (short-subunit alcohol dehydrogenase family)